MTTDSWATRLPVGLAVRGGWGDTRLDLSGNWVEVLTGRAVSCDVADVLAELPVALLVRA